MIKGSSTVRIPGYKPPRPEEVRERLAEACREAQPLWEWCVHTKWGFWLSDKFYLKWQLEEYSAFAGLLFLSEELARNLIESSQIVGIASLLVRGARAVYEGAKYPLYMLEQTTKGRFLVERYSPSKTRKGLERMIDKHKAEADRIQVELDGLCPRCDEGGVVRSILCERIAYELFRAQEICIEPGQLVGRGDLIHEYVQMSILRQPPDDVVWPDEWAQKYDLIRQTLNQISERVPRPRARGSHEAT